MQNPKIKPVRIDTKMSLLLSQRTILKMQEQIRQIQDAIQKEEKAFFDLVSKEAMALKISVKEFTFDVEKLVFIPINKKPPIPEIGGS